MPKVLRPLRLCITTPFDKAAYDMLRPYVVQYGRSKHLKKFDLRKGHRILLPVPSAEAALFMWRYLNRYGARHNIQLNKLRALLARHGIEPPK